MKTDGELLDAINSLLVAFDASPYENVDSLVQKYIVDVFKDVISKLVPITNMLIGLSGDTTVDVTSTGPGITDNSQ